MHPRLQRQVRILDRWEREFLAAVRKLLAARVNALEPVVKAALEPGGEKVVEKLGRLRALPGDYLPLLERYVGHLLVEGMVQGRSDVEFLRSRLQRRGVRLAARVDGEPVIPEDAIDFIRHRRDLGRFFEQDQVDTVRTILDNGLKEGATVNQVMDALRIALPEAIGKARAENIARTEATTAFNQGRMAAFRETKGFVGAVEFMAITDARTTPICMERDGLVLAIDDPRLPDNTPPLHYMCRSVLSPVSEFELEDLGGQAYLDKQRDKLDGLPPPLKGFGNEPGLDGGRPPGQPPVVRSPRGPKGTAGGEGSSRADVEADRSPSVRVDAAPEPTSGPIRQETDVLRSGEKLKSTEPLLLPVNFNGGLSLKSPIVQVVLQDLMRFPEPARRLLEEAGYQIHFTTGPLWDLPFLDTMLPWEISRIKKLTRGFHAATVHFAFGDPRNTMVFGPGILLPSPALSVGCHEGGHALVNSRRLDRIGDAVAAWRGEREQMPEEFRTFAEFSGEVTGRFYYGDDEHKKELLRRAPQFCAILEGDKMRIERRANLSSAVKTSETLYFGEDGSAIYDIQKDVIDVWLTVNKKVVMGAIVRDGRMMKLKSHTWGIGGLTLSTSKIVEIPEKTAAAVKAFLRSKGVTLPHVMS